GTAKSWHAYSACRQEECRSRDTPLPSGIAATGDQSRSGGNALFLTMITKSNTFFADIKSDLAFLERDYVGGVATVDRTRQHSLVAYPEGGYGWVVVLGAFLVFHAGFGLVLSFGIWNIYYQSTFPIHKVLFVDKPPQWIISIGALQLAVLNLSGLVAGRLVNRVSARASLIVGSSFIVYSLFCVSLSEQLWEFYLSHSILLGTGIGLCYNPALYAVTQWFRQKRALAVGISFCGAYLGGVTWPVIFYYAYKKLDFPMANRTYTHIKLPLTLGIIAIIVAVELFIATFLVKERIPKSSQKVGKWDFTAFKDNRFVFMCLGNLVSSFGFWVAPFFTVWWLRLNGVTTAYLTICLMNAASIPGNLLAGYLADRYGNLNVLTSTTFLTGLVNICFWLPNKTIDSVFFFSILYGFLSGGYFSLYAVSMKRIAVGKGFAAQLGMFNFSATLGVLFGTPVAILLNWDLAFALSGAAMIIGSLFIAKVRWSLNRTLFAKV
ncbi:Riboflavin transporter MCH5, partial [Neolecta irregularis DAH-3]